MISPSRFVLACSALTLVASAQLHAVTITKADNTTNMGNALSWLGGAQPTSVDIALFNSTVSTSGTSNSAAMGSARTWGQIQVTNIASPFTFNTGAALVLNGVNGVGIDMSAASADLIMNVSTTLGANQTWNIGSGRTLTISGSFSQNGAALALAGAGTLNKSTLSLMTLSSGTGAFTGNVRANAGVLTLNSGALGSGGTLTFNSGTLTYGAGNTDDIGSRITNSASAIMINTGTGTDNVTLSSIGSTNTGGLTRVGSGTLTLGANSYSGTTTINSAGGSNAVLISSKDAFSTGQVVINGGTALINATVDLTGANKVMNNFTLVNNLSNNSTASSLEYGGNFNLNGTNKAITNNGVNTTTTFSGVLSNDAGTGVTFVTTGTIALTGLNTFTGTAQFRGARALLVSTINNSGVAGNLGQGNVIQFGSNSPTGAYLKYVGTGETTDRILQFNTTTGDMNLEHNGTGLLHFTGTTATTAAGAKTLNLIASNSGTGRIDGSVVDNGGALSVAKSGTGTWILAGNNTYTGTTSVTAGTLILNGSNTSAVAVGSGGTLGGSGSTTGAVTVAAGGALAPGNSPGIISTGNLTLAGSLVSQIGKSGLSPIPGTDYDQVNVTGTVDLTGGDLTLSLLSGVQVGDLYFLIANDGGEDITGFFTTLNNVATTLTQGSQFNVGSNYFQISYTGNYTGSSVTNSFTGGNDLVLLAVVPEPSTWALLGLGFGVLIWRARSRRTI